MNKAQQQQALDAIKDERQRQEFIDLLEQAKVKFKEAMQLVAKARAIAKEAQHGRR